MSFSSDVKNEMAGVLPDKPCCRLAQAYGMLECGHAFGKEEVSLQSEQESVVEVYVSLVSSVCGVGMPSAGTVRRRTTLQTRFFPEEKERVKILATFGHAPGELSVRLNRANIECEQCVRSFLRGAFLACGAVTDPTKEYHLSFTVPHYNFSKDLLSLLREADIPVKAVSRNGSYILYLKGSEQIEDCLTFLGAPRAALEMMNVKMVKSIRNETNRRLNCENANIDKTVAAAGEHRKALQRIEETIGIAGLPENLREIARLRLDNPDMSLRDLGEALDPPLSRSGVNHRLQKILEIASSLK